MSKQKPTFVEIEKITLDPDVQDRVEVNEEAILDYVRNVQDLPPVRLWEHEGILLLSAGHHTLEAHKRAGLVAVQALVQKGPKEDAILDAVRSNAGHGAPRTNADKRRAVRQLVVTFPTWTKSLYASNANVSADLVDAVIKEVEEEKASAADSPVAEPEAKRRTSRSGQAVPANRKVATEQRSHIAALLKKDMDRPGRQIAKEVGCSAHTVEAVRRELKREAAGLTQPPAERQPGEDDVVVKPKPKGRKATGLPVFSWKDFGAALGVIARAGDDLVKAYPKEKGGAEFNGHQRLYAELHDLWEKWKKRLVRSPKKPEEPKEE